MEAPMSLPDTSASVSAQAAMAADFLRGFLNKVLHVHIEDGRMFVGQLKCTDRERNLILAVTHEYRAPSQADVRRAAASSHASEKTVRLDMKKRFVGLVVVPGKYITKIEVEE